MRHWKHALGKGATLAVVALLHLLILVYLTMPPAPEYSSARARPLSRNGALQLVFLKQRHPSANIASPRADSTTTRAGRRSSSPTSSMRTPTPKALDAPRSDEPQQAREADSQRSVGLSEETISIDSSYGNPLLKDIRGGSPTQEHPRLPGSADGELVKAISVGERPSPRQILQEGGKFLNCSQVRMARFLSASEMDKRHITTHELDQAFTGFGCT